MRLDKNIRPELRHWLFALTTIPLCLQWLMGDGGEPFLSPGSIVPYALAAGIAGAWLWALPIVFNDSEQDRRSLLGIFLFTGSVGMVFLQGIYWLAMKSRGYEFSGTLDASFFWHIIRLIDISSLATNDANAGFLVSLCGYVFGVALPEEFVKIIPVWFVLEKKLLPRWGDALFVGLVSGLGFGIAEAIHYSDRFYNGSSPAILYATRFVSCVALHAAWSGIAALQIERKRSQVFGNDNILVVTVMVCVKLATAVALHGMYDTFLKCDMFGLAVLTAIASCLSLCVLIERAREPDAQASHQDRLRHIRAKIACDGMDSLTADEFEILQRARRTTRVRKSPSR